MAGPALTINARTDQAKMCDGGHCAPSTPAVSLVRMWMEEVAMTAAVKKTGTRLVRWFEEYRRKNRPPYKWYEHELYGG